MKNLEGNDILKLNSHIYLARKMLTYYRNNTGYVINEDMYLLGTCAPDIFPFKRLKLHNMNRLSKYLENTLDSLKKGEMGRLTLSYFLGIICHYVADTFCYSHNEYIYNLRAHISYENFLHEYIVSRYDITYLLLDIGLNSPENICHHIKQQHQHYLSNYTNEWSSMASSDLSFTLYIMLILCSELLNTFDKASYYKFAFETGLKQVEQKSF